MGQSQKLQKVDITLSDCLACSGCITSAESVLITQQSQDEMMKVFNHNRQLKEVSKSTSGLNMIIQSPLHVLKYVFENLCLVTVWQGE